MKKKLIIGLTVAILIGAVVTGYLLFVKNPDKEDSANPADILSSQLDKACQILTEEKAKTILGPSATKSYDGEVTNSSSDDIAISHCAYEDGASNKVATDTKVRASLVSRTYRTENGKTANQTVFDKSSRPDGSVDVTGYGDLAFWNPEFGQLNILKNGNWYVIEYGSLIPDTRTQGDTLKFADILKSEL